MRQRILPFLWVLQSLSRGQRCAPPVSVLLLAAGLCAGLSGLPVLVQMWQQGAPLWLDSGLCDVAVGRAGTTTRNIGMTIITYGMVWVLWLIVNRFLCEYITMVDGYLTFAQIAGEIILSVRTVLCLRCAGRTRGTSLQDAQRCRRHRRVQCGMARFGLFVCVMSP